MPPGGRRQGSANTRHREKGGSMRPFLYAAPIAGIIGLVYAGSVVVYILRLDSGTDRMKAIASAIQEGASAYLNRQYIVIAIL